MTQADPEADTPTSAAVEYVCLVTCWRGRVATDAGEEFRRKFSTDALALDEMQSRIRWLLQVACYDQVVAELKRGDVTIIMQTYTPTNI